MFLSCVAALEDGDDAELLLSEEQLLAREYEQRNHAKDGIDMDRLSQRVQAGDEEAVEEATHQQAMSGPTMLFASLTDDVPSSMRESLADYRRRRAVEGHDVGPELDPDAPLTWTDQMLEALSTQWKEMLFAAGLSGEVYRLEPQSLMVGLQRGWHGKEVKDFLLGQPEVKEVTWDGKTYHKPKGGKKKRRQGSKKKAKHRDEL
jgi:hypothetical protein